MAGLRPAEIEESIKLVMKVRDELGITIFMVEHIMKTIMKISDRIVVLEYGRQIAKGTPKEVSEDADVIKAYLGEDRTGDEYRAKG
jgi:branched-chain amino acid transport system ATP-binding protein